MEKKTLLFIAFVTSLMLLSGCKSYTPKDVEKVDCKTVNKEDAMVMCLDMAEQCSTPEMQMKCYEISYYVNDGSALCGLAKALRKQCKN